MMLAIAVFRIYIKDNNGYTKKLLALALCIMPIVTCHAQTLDKHSIDSMQQEIQRTQAPGDKAFLMSQLSMKLSDITPVSGLQTGLQGAAIAQAAQDDEDMASCFNSVGWNYYRLGKTDSAIYYLQKAISIFHRLHRSSNEAKSLINLSSIYQNEDNDDKSLGFLLTAATLFDSAHDELSKAYTENMIGISYRKQTIYDKALLYSDNAIAALSALKEYGYLADAFESRGNIYFAMKRWDSAFVYYDKSIFTAKKMNHIYGVAYGSEDKAEVFLAINEEHVTPHYLDSALYYYQQSSILFAAAGEASDVANEQLNMGKTLLLLGKDDLAKNYLNQGFTEFIATKSYMNAYKAATELSKLYENEKDYKKAFDYLNQSLVYKDSVDVEKQRKTIDNLLIKYETDKKDKAIQLLNTQNELVDKELSKNRLILLFSLGLTVLLIIIGFILRTQSRIRQQLKEVRMRHQIASDLHDDVGSSLSSILLLSNMAAQQTTDKSLLDKIGSNTKEVIDKMSDIVWTMKPGNDEGSSLKEKLEKLGLLIRDVSGIEVIMNISEKLEIVKLNMHTRKNVFLTCKESMNNVLKHANASTINFSVAIIDRDILITINDNGKGFDKTQVKKNNGTETMLQRAKDCGGTCIIHSIPEQGTTVSVRIPIPRSRYRFS
jgi:two-component system, NarL family, sensor histidine kinase UhpB